MKKSLLLTLGALLLVAAASVASQHSIKATEKPRAVPTKNDLSNLTILAATQEVTPIDWETSAAGFKGEKGKTYVFRCPADGSAKPIYGSDIYTDDSSICTAAVHVGLISLERGGLVTIEIRPGREIYGSTTRNSVKSNNFGVWNRSFVILSSNVSQYGPGKDSSSHRPASDGDSSDITPIEWDTNAGGFKGAEGQTYKFRCPAQGSAKSIYGSDVYTDDSSICTAGVHAGLISLERGGLVTIEFRPGRSTYGSTTRHGVKSDNYGEWARSFVIR